MNPINYVLIRFEAFRTKVKINPYVFAIFALVVGVTLQFLLNASTHQTNYLLLVISLFFAAWYGGFFPSLLITVIGFLIADYFFIPPVHTFFPDPLEYVRAAIFLLEGILFGLAGEARKIREKAIDKAYKAELKARKDAEEASRIRDDFISIASHELKSPITNQRLYIQLLEKQLAKNHDVKAKQDLAMINNQTSKMISLIDDLLNVSKIRAGKFEMHYGRFNLNDCLRDVVNEVRLSNNTHVITIQGTCTKQVYGDKERISQVLTNLLSNAIKYSPKSKKVIVVLSETKKQTVVSVKDFGIGINKANQKYLFTKYFRAEGPSERKYKGFGMGLFIVSEILKLHKGKIWVKSTESKGSTFSFSLPHKKLGAGNPESYISKRN